MMRERSWTRLSAKSLRLLDESVDMDTTPTAGENDQLSATSERSLVLSESSQSSYVSIENVKPFLHSPLSEHPRASYNDPERNIFLRMQDLDPISTNSPVLYKKIPPPDNMLLSSDNSVWFEYFYHLALQWDSASVPRFVPGLLYRMYGLSLNHFALRQSLMGQAAGYFAIMNQQPLSKSRQFLTQLLPDVQRAISTLTFDEGHLCAVLQLVKIYAQFSDTKGAHRHLQGLRLMVEHLLSKDDNPHPLVMCVWRAAIYFDMCFAFEGIPLALPTPERKTDDTHRLWLENFIPSSQPLEIEYPLAQFELDDLEHHVMSLLQLRNASTFSPERDDAMIRKAAEDTLQTLKEWMEKPLIQCCEKEEVQYRMHEENISSAAAFLHYPPLIFNNEKYALLLISYHSLVILTTLLSNPGIGPYPHIRFASAVTLCRIFAFNDWKRRYQGRTGSLHWHTHDLFRAGLVLGESTYPLEFAWIIERLREKKFSFAHQMADSLIAAWRTGGSVMTVYGEMRKANSYLQDESVEEYELEELDDTIFGM